MSFVFSRVEYCDMRFVYGFYNGNARAAVEEYQGRFPDLQSVTVQSEGKDVQMLNTRENILEMVQRSPRLSTCRMASCMGVSRMHVWRPLQDEEFYSCHDQSVQHLVPCDYAQRMDLCHWVQAHHKLLRVILFSDEALLPGTV
jgi:hypothetical protein